MLDLRVIFMDISPGRCGPASVEMEGPDAVRGSVPDSVSSTVGKLSVRLEIPLIDDDQEFLAGQRDRTGCWRLPLPRRCSSGRVGRPRPERSGAPAHHRRRRRTTSCRAGTERTGRLGGTKGLLIQIRVTMSGWFVFVI